MRYHGTNGAAWPELSIRCVDAMTPTFARLQDACAKAGLSMEEFSRALNSLQLTQTLTGPAIVRVDDPPPLPKRALALDGKLP